MTADLAAVAAYYERKLGENGPGARGVDWNGEEGQTRRFAELCRLLPEAPAPASINDLGCGYGALHDFLTESGRAVDYRGYDVAPAMIAAARAAHPALAADAFTCADRPDRVADFSLASGIFNVRLEASDSGWASFILATLDALDATSRRGFAFNCLTSYADRDRMRADLYYAEPLALFDHCKRHYARDVALLHDYGLFEFTILVRKG